MASSLPNSLSSIILLSLAIIFLVIPTTTSRRALQQNAAPTGFKIQLKHVDAGTNFTKFERLQRAMKRGRHRMQKLSAMAVKSLDASSEVQSHVHAGNGEFLMQLSIGTPPNDFSAIMDTGSDLIWTQCKPCQDCFKQSTPIFNPKNSKSFSAVPCSSSLCEALPMANCDDKNCQYLYAYGDYSSTQGILATETFTFGKASVPNIGFGCGEDNEGDGFAQGAGLVGLGRGPLSLVSQMKEPKFSYCLTSIDDTKSTSSLLMGSMANANAKGKIKTTPLIHNPLQPTFYYLSLHGITVGDTRLSIEKSDLALNEDGSGGMIIDSGTTLTYLEETAYDKLKKEFISQTQLAVADSSQTGLDLCFNLPQGADNVDIPKLIFHFDGASLDLPGENYMIADPTSGLVCLAVGPSSGMSIFGNIQQQNTLVLHDLGRGTISFIPTNCDNL